MSRLSTTIHLLLLFTLVVLILFLFYLAFYLPKKEQLTESQTEVSILEKKLYSERLRRDQLKGALSQKMTSKKEIPSTILRDSNDMPSLLATWTQKGKALGIEFLLFEPLAETTFDTVIEIPIKVTLRGTFHQTLEFFNFLSKLEKKVFISDIEMTQPEKLKGEYVISTHAKVTTFRRTSL